jgi:hypothetical protein
MSSYIIFLKSKQLRVFRALNQQLIFYDAMCPGTA